MAMIIPDTYPITIIKGREFEIEFTFEAFNLAGYTVTSQIRTLESQSATLIEEFTVVVTPGTDSTVVLFLSDTETDAITQTTGYYDVLLTEPAPGSADYTYIRGPVQFIGSVTAKV